MEPRESTTTRGRGSQPCLLNFHRWLVFVHGNLMALPCLVVVFLVNPYMG